MLLMRNHLRYLSTGLLVDKLVNISQASSQDQRHIQLKQFIDLYLEQKNKTQSDLINDVIHRWSVEQPTKEALRIYEKESENYQKLTFDDVHIQSSRLANVLTGSEYNLKAGKTVLVILPDLSKDRILLQLACLRSGCIFCPWDPKDLTHAALSERIRKLVVDCIITTEENLEVVNKFTHLPIRPLKKGVIIKSSRTEPLPVGWNHSMQSMGSTYRKTALTHPNTPVIRRLSNEDNRVIEYTRQTFSLRLILTALWFNIEQSHLLWMTDPNEMISIAPWLFGSSIFIRKTNNARSIRETLETYPIDTFCASAAEYQMFDKEQIGNRTNLKQLFSTEVIDRPIKDRWYSLTNLSIRDNYNELNMKSMLEDLLSYNQVKQRDDDHLQFSSSRHLRT